MKQSHIPKINTKERIEEIALELFSVYGYNSVSIRDICKKLGFTESSIYYHFKNKQAIMDSLLDKVDLLIGDMKARFALQFNKINKISADEMCYVAVGVLKNYLLNPYVFKIISMLTVEMLSDKKSYDIYQKIVFQLPLEQQENVFSEMITRGFIKKNNPAILAQQYYSIIYLAFQKNCIGCVLTDDVLVVSSNEITNNIRDFFLKLN